MNKAELDRNEQLTENVVHDLNIQPQLPYDDSSFDAITNVVSVDYLNHPIELFVEMMRVMRPGGLAIMSFSNRMFWTKAIKLWTGSNEWQRVLVCAAYFHFTGFQDIQAFEITTGEGNPMFVVRGTKPKGKSEL